MKRLYGLLAIGLILGLTSGASAHIGERVYLLFEMLDEDTGDLDFTDGTVEDWEDVVGEPNFLPTDLYSRSHSGRWCSVRPGGPRLSHLVGLERHQWHDMVRHGAHR